MANIMRDACERANQRMLVKGGGECRQGPTHVWKVRRGSAGRDHPRQSRMLHA